MPKAAPAPDSVPFIPTPPAELEDAGVFMAERVIEFCEGYPEPERGTILSAFRRRLKQQNGVYRMACVSDVVPAKAAGSADVNHSR